MKKRHVMGLVLLFAVAAICLAPVAVQGRPSTRLASGGFYLGLSDPGTATCVGGTPTGWFPPCTPGTHVSIWRRFVGPVVFDTVTGDAAPYFTGAWTIRGSCNLKENLVGPCWGTFAGDALDGKWEGTWNGKLDFTSFGGELSFAGHGTGGSVDGLQMRMEAASGGGSEYAPMPFTARVFKVGE
jgi:hypothetical protein